MGAKGEPKTGGRTKGTPNKRTYALRDKIREFSEENFDEVIEAWHRIDEPKDKIKAYIELTAYAMPKLQAIQVDANVSHQSDVEDDLRKLAEE